MSSPLVLVQEIIVEWGDASRGAAMAQRRRQLLKPTPLPEVKVEQESRVVVDRLGYADWDDFKGPHSVVNQFNNVATPALGRVSLAWANGLVVSYRLGSGHIRTKHFRLNAGESGRVEYNERVAWEDCWRYQQRLISIALLDGFKRRMPRLAEDKSIQDLVHLYYS